MYMQLPSTIGTISQLCSSKAQSYRLCATSSMRGSLGSNLTAIVETADDGLGVIILGAIEMVSWLIDWLINEYKRYRRGSLLELGEEQEGKGALLSLFRAKFGKQARDALEACSQEWSAVGSDLMMEANIDADDAYAKLVAARKTPRTFKMWVRHFLGAFMITLLGGTVGCVKALS